MALFFWSGLSNVGDLRAATLNGIAAGVDASELSVNATRQAGDHLAAGFPLFVDSGAFGAFTSLAKGRGNGECDWPRVFRTVDALLKHARCGRLFIVAPDKVGDQRRTLELLTEHRERIAGWADSGAKVLVAHQSGPMDLVKFGRCVAEILHGIDYAPALPCRAGAVTPAVAIRFVAALQPRSLHLLGAGRSWRGEIRELEHFCPGLAISHDANRLRSFMGEGHPFTTRMRSRADEIAAAGVRGAGELCWCDETEMTFGLLNVPGFLACLPRQATEFLAERTGIAVAELRRLDAAEAKHDGDDEYCSALGKALANRVGSEEYLWHISAGVSKIAARVEALRCARVEEIGHAHRADDGVRRYASESQVDMFAA